MTIPTCLIDNLYSSFGADDANYIICSTTNNALYYIVDGHSQKSGSAEIVKSFFAFVKSQIKLSEIHIDNVCRKVTDLLELFRESVKRKFPRAAMCFVIVVKIDNTLHTFYLGDCRLGKFLDESNISWITKPHSAVLQQYPNMSEDDLRINEDNHIIYKQFTAKKFVRPEYIEIPSHDCKYILATDGFWKLLPEQQVQILNRKEIQLEDDIAFLKF